ncbi:sensor histidine kinase [Actinomadura hibisca]|uniref:sensor histidine kinase n=1 Tax=Actinomadura hibisca TaxID=68565 RepID=UPI00082D6FB1|nr:ATP-binding protein [Actinomadura hibisca]
MTVDQKAPEAEQETAADAPAGPPVFGMPTRQEEPARGYARLRLGQIYRVGTIVLGLLLLVTISQTVLALYQHNQARETLIGQVDPATLKQFDLSSAFGRQDTAIRNYASTGDPAQLQVYRQGVRDEAAAAAEIRRLLDGVSGSRPVLDRLTRLTADSAAWRRGFAEPIATGTGRGDLPAATERTGGVLFGAIRTGNVGLQDALTRMHGGIAGQLERRAAITYWSIGGALTSIVLASIAMGLLIRRTVLRPVSDLSARVRAVSQGDFTHPLDVRGPVEISELATIIDAMRRRILDEWRVSSEARQRLDEQTAELRRSNAELEQFAYVASHDLQEPLRKVASFCQMLERRYGDQLDDRGRQYVEFAVDGAKRMQALINDLLSFSRVGRLSRTEDAVDLAAVARQSMEDLSTLREETGAQVEIGELPAVTGDRTQLGQLFLNLMGNAIKFRREGVPPRVEITARREGAFWEFACADNGIGVEPRYADRIFLIFQRLHPRDEYTGTGIGLALCKKIVEYHGGRIWLDTEGRDEGDPGTTIRWTLPAGEEKSEDHDGS